MVSDYKTRNSIDIAKHFSFFNKLDMKDRKALLKANVLGMGLFRLPPYLDSFSDGVSAGHVKHVRQM